VSETPSASTNPGDIPKDSALGFEQGGARATAAARPSLADARRAGRQRRAGLKADLWENLWFHSSQEAQNRRRDLQRTSRSLRQLSPPTAAAATALAMFAGYATIHQILALSDVSVLDSYVLPIGFGPVFVLLVKFIVSGWIDADGDPDSAPARRRAVFTRAVIPVAVLATVVLVIGVALKSMLVGTIEEPSETVMRWSSVVLFAGLILGEVGMASALAAYQSKPGAREWEWLFRRDRSAQRRMRRDLRRRSRAQGAYEELAAVSSVHSRRRSVKQELGLRWGRIQALRAAPDGSWLHDHTRVEASLHPAVAGRVLAEPSELGDGQPRLGPSRRIGQSLDREPIDLRDIIRLSVDPDGLQSAPYQVNGAVNAGPAGPVLSLANGSPAGSTTAAQSTAAPSMASPSTAAPSTAATATATASAPAEPPTPNGAHRVDSGS
jgi:hypothetical protein